MLYIVEEHAYLEAHLGVAVGFGSSSSINGSHEAHGCESLPLSRVHSIEDGELRFCHIKHEKEASRNCVRPIVNWRLRCRHASTDIHLISAVKTLRWTAKIKSF